MVPAKLEESAPVNIIESIDIVNLEDDFGIVTRMPPAPLPKRVDANLSAKRLRHTNL